MSDHDFERKKVCYEQNFEQARSLNRQMNQVPVLAMTLTGGLWFGAGVTENLDVEIRYALLMFAGFCNLALVLAVLRIRDVLESYLERIKAFNGNEFASGRPQKPKIPWLGSYSMISIYSVLMMLASIFSFIGAFWKYWPFTEWRVLGIIVFILLLIALYFVMFRRSTPTEHGQGG